MTARRSNAQKKDNNKALTTRDKAIELLKMAKKQEKKTIPIRLSRGTVVYIDAEKNITSELISELKQKYHV